MEQPPREQEQTAPAPIHHADTLDLVLVHDGGGTLVLDDGRHPVAAGDCIVIPGVDHVLDPDPGGCRISVVTIGTPPRQ